MLKFHPSALSASELSLRNEVRTFLAEQFPLGGYLPGLGGNAEASREFSKALAARGWVGMSVPREYGGHGRTSVERFVVAEELLAVGAPISAHWAGDRQIAAGLLNFGTEAQKQRLLPMIVNADAFFCLGMSEPESGSDLASVRTRAVRVEDGWLLNGQKVWTSGAHYADFAVTLCRTAPPSDDRHAGLSQVIVDLHSPGVTVRPILMLNGFHHFNEVFFEDVFIPDSMVLGEVGSGWQQITSELAFERSGPDRFMSTFPVLQYFLFHRAAGGSTAGLDRLIGQLTAKYWVLRNLSLSVAQSLDAGEVPNAQAALVKDIGTVFEQEVVDVLRELSPGEQEPDGDLFDQLLAEATITAPIFTIRGGTTEVLRGIAAKAVINSFGNAT